ncbi:MAG: FtsW/RodA/SpoVE family cell cycle protein, partial [Lachnospiraceae bacterium]|nr:FtsW/RodA/SpoVE family cell cycle protein [Lachnospiraceae bacterium]
MFKQYQFRNYRFKLVFLVYLLTTIGILVIGSAEKSFQSQQILGLVLGSAALLVCSLIDYKLLMQFHWLVYLVILILLVLVLTPLGKVVNGAQRWIDLGFMTLQPSELAKVMLSLFFAKF